jgi:Flp pilus assembly protein TadD
MNSPSKLRTSGACLIAVRPRKTLLLIPLIYLTALFVSGVPCGAAPAQAVQSLPSRISIDSLQNQFVNWRVAGRVATLKGAPVAAVKIQLDIDGQPKKFLQTNFRGSFEAAYQLNRDQYSHLRVRVTASKAGYHLAYEVADYPSNDKAWVIDVILREKGEDALAPPLASVVGLLGPKLLEAATHDQGIEPQRKEFRVGTEKFLTRHKSLEALADLQKVVDRWPNCPACRALLGLAQLDAGSWASALREINKAATPRADRPREPKFAAPLLLLGVVEEWCGKPERATAFLAQSLALEPENPMALEEMGRALIARNNWPAACQYLGKAVKLGAPPEVHLLLARAQLQLGKEQDARAELAQFRGERKPGGSSPTTRLAFAELDQLLKLEARRNIVPLISQDLPDLLKALPELKGLEPASSQEELPEILRRTGANVESFFRTIPDTISQENVREERLGKQGTVTHSLDQSFQYLVLVQTGQTNIDVTEYRGDSQGRKVLVDNPDGRFMLTAGFTSLNLIFHPAFQCDANFRYLGSQLLQGHKAVVIVFAQTPQNIKLLEQFSVGHTTVPILQQGVAWIDAESFQILRMRTDLLKAPPEFELRKQSTDVIYDKVEFGKETWPVWLPREVAVTVELKDRSWHNLHRYSAFRRFRVAATQQIKDPQCNALAPPGGSGKCPDPESDH